MASVLLLRHVRPVAALAVAVFGAACVTWDTPASAATAYVQGTAFKDLDGDQVADAGEERLSGLAVWVLDAAGSTYVGGATTDSTGSYAVAVPTDGTYTVMIAPSSWSSWQQDWVPTTTGSIRARTTVAVSGGAGHMDFGIRPIVRSTTLGSPLSSYTGGNGLVVESYDDAVTARDLFDDLMSGSMVGAEAAHVLVRFDIGTSSSTTTGVGTSNGSYTQYDAVSYVTYSSWMADGDATLFHEYGHAWSLYYAYLVQQDPSLTGYLKARGLADDSRVGSSYEWSPRELIAEDYRQLFGSANARQQAQMNPYIPPAAQVTGLGDYLSGAFRSAPAGSTGGSSGGSTGATTAPSLTVETPTVNPTPVSKSGTISTTISASASVTVQVLDSSGRVVRTLLSSAARSAGSVSVKWDRKNDAGQRVRAGTYTALVVASDGSSSPSASTGFRVS
jgi:hypothetical protein